MSQTSGDLPVVLHLRSGTALFGPERVILALAGRAATTGFRSVIFGFNARGQPDVPLLGAARTMGVQAERLDTARPLEVGALRQVLRAIARHGADVLHCHDFKANFYGLLAAKMRRLPVVSTLHLWTAADGTTRWYEWLDKRILARRLDRLVCVSPAIQKEALAAGASPARVSVILNGVETEGGPQGDRLQLRRQWGLPAEALVVGTVARLAEQKGHEYLFQAIAAVAAQEPKVRLVVVGDGPLGPQLRARAAELGLSERILFTGLHPNPIELYPMMDVFALASLSEGLPIALLEAMGAGLPAVATGVGAVPEVVLDGETGRLVRPTDVEALAAALLSLLAEPGLRRRLGEAGQSHVKRAFSADAMAQQYAEIYREVLAQRAPAR